MLRDILQRVPPPYPTKNSKQIKQKKFSIVGCQYLYDEVFMPAGFFNKKRKAELIKNKTKKRLLSFIEIGKKKAIKKEAKYTMVFIISLFINELFKILPINFYLLYILLEPLLLLYLI